ncbi:hypothetical protein Pcinc_034468 [Petrolisthes cinctipes]|uniref:Uncharacterized protein n=1 Tax=Petrolisthes cinctipes TaxID=88211 RepID=A0AAE1EQ83_PETCI|nr:hypothetical protein Pcinc_034468 [Petrolisthes cinctipes]
MILESSRNQDEYVQFLGMNRGIIELKLKRWTEDPTRVLSLGDSSRVYPVSSQHFPNHSPLCIKVLQQAEIIGPRTIPTLPGLIQEAQNL